MNKGDLNDSLTTFATNLNFLRCHSNLNIRKEIAYYKNKLNCTCELKEYSEEEIKKKIADLESELYNLHPYSD